MHVHVCMHMCVHLSLIYFQGVSVKIEAVLLEQRVPEKGSLTMAAVFLLHHRLQVDS